MDNKNRNNDENINHAYGINCNSSDEIDDNINNNSSDKHDD